MHQPVWDALRLRPHKACNGIHMTLDACFWPFLGRILPKLA